MLLAGEKRKTFPSDTLITINPARTGLGPKRGVPGEMLTRNGLRNCTTIMKRGKNRRTDNIWQRNKIQQDKSNLYVHVIVDV